MSRTTKALGVAVLVACALGLGYVGWQMSYQPGMQACGACGRPVDDHSRSTGLVDEKPATFCCPTCALTLHRQTGANVRITALTDYETGQCLDPPSAFVVTKSDLNLCMRRDMLRTERAEAAPLDFDRCSPSIIAFATESGAEMFAGRHGGRVVSFDQVASQYGEAVPAPDE